MDIRKMAITKMKFIKRQELISIKKVTIYVDMI